MWNHSAHIIDFVRAVVQDRTLENAGPDANGIISSLKNLALALERPNPVQDSAPSKANITKVNAPLSMPPLDAAVGVLKWVKGM